MTAAQIITKFRALIDDTLDSDLELQLVNDAIYEVDEEVQPAKLKAKDTSLSTTAGQTYTTSRALPSDFFLPFDYIYVGTEKIWQIRFEDQVKYQDIWGYYWIDHANNTYYLTGTQPSAQTITFLYLKTSTELDDTSDTPYWPSRFHRLIPLKMAKIYFPIDQGDRSLSWRPEWEEEYQLTLSGYRNWDMKLKLQALGRQTPYGEATKDGPHKIDLD